ncbi:unnamed protein product [Closterium sp. NIES-65]|nr:unnamed protein product [Closterium sp. NIES-65]
MHAPVDELEQSLVWRHATLPVCLGGLGLIDPLSEAPAAYLASLHAANTLLRHMTLTPDNPLQLVADLVSPMGGAQGAAAGEVTLLDLRNRLPDQAREILKAKHQKGEARRKEERRREAEKGGGARGVPRPMTTTEEAPEEEVRRVAELGAGPTPHEEGQRRQTTAASTTTATRPATAQAEHPGARRAAAVEVEGLQPSAGQRGQGETDGGDGANHHGPGGGGESARGENDISAHNAGQASRPPRA